MKQRLVLFVILIFSMMSICFGCISEGELENINHNSTDTIAVILPAEDGFQSLSAAEGCFSLTDSLDIFIALAEKKGHSIVLQGAAGDKKLSNLRYRTDDEQESVDWSKLPVFKSKTILGNTCGALKNDRYNQYDRLVVISGRMNPAEKQGTQKINALVPTYLFQLVPFDNNLTLFDLYTKITEMHIDDLIRTSNNGFSVYQVSDKDNHHAEVSSKIYNSFRNDSFLDELLTEILFDGCVDIPLSSFELPASITDDVWMVATGDDLTQLSVALPDGTKMSFDSGEYTTDDHLDCRTLVRNGKQIKIASLMSLLPSKRLELDNGEHDFSAKLYYTFSKKMQDILQNATLIDEGALEENYYKKTYSFKAADTSLFRELMTIYPELRLTVTVVKDDTQIGSIIAEDNNPGEVKFEFTESGDYNLEFGLVNGENELIRQTIAINVKDQPLQFTRENGEELVIHPDLNEEMVWSVDEWFTDPDENDYIQITMKSDDEGKIAFSGDTRQLMLNLDDSMTDGSEVVTLQAVSDTSEATGTVQITWRYLTSQLNNLEMKTCQIVPASGNDPLTKRARVSFYAELNIEGPDAELIYQQLENCKANVLDWEGNQVAEAAFDRPSASFYTESFELPDKSGEYSWTLQLQSTENNVPLWTYNKETDSVRIENHAPLADESLLAEECFGEFLLDNPNEWTLLLPTELFTDPDGDPVNVSVLIEKNEEHPTEFTWEPEEPIQLDQFGDYRITFRACDNEQKYSETEISRAVSLADITAKLNSLTGTLSVVSEEENQKKNSQMGLVFKLNNAEWTDVEEQIYSEWLANCVAEVLQDDQVLQDADIQYNQDEQSFAVKIHAPDRENIYNYRIVLSSASDDARKVKITSDEPYEIQVLNQPPFVNPDVVLEDFDGWVNSAEDVRILIPTDVILDYDNDIVTRHIKVIDLTDYANPLLDEEAELPVEVSFEPFSSLQMRSDYEIIITYCDNDEQTCDRVIHVVLKNKRLLLALIAVATVIMLVVIAAILFFIHRKRMPSFHGAIVFQYQGKDVSKPIDLSPWGKQKKVPLQIFAAAISVLLSENQWDELGNLELRPDRESGFRLYQKKTGNTEQMPYFLAAKDLVIVNPNQTDKSANEITQSVKGKHSRT